MCFRLGQKILAKTKLSCGTVHRFFFKILTFFDKPKHAENGSKLRGAHFKLISKHLKFY